MSAFPRVTVLMTVYNGLPYLREAIDSVLNQNYGDFEFLIIDDASTDDSVRCIETYRDPRIRLLCNECNLGQTRSLNRGIEEAKGAYVARLDQDDVCLPSRLGEQVACLNERPDIAVVGSWAYRIDLESRGTGEWRPRIKDHGDFLGWLLLFRCPLLHPSVMFRRKVVAEIGGYDSAYAPAEDYELWVRLAVSGFHAYVIPKSLIKYRVHLTQRSSVQLEIQHDCKRRAHQVMVDSFSERPEARALGRLLRLEPGLWEECQSQEELCAVFNALSAMLTRLQKRLSLNANEATTLRRAVLRWVGPGIVLARRLERWPSLLFYPILFALSPFLIPRVRLLAGRIADNFRRLRFVTTGFKSEP